MKRERPKLLALWLTVVGTIVLVGYMAFDMAGTFRADPQHPVASRPHVVKKG